MRAVCQNKYYYILFFTARLLIYTFNKIYAIYRGARTHRWGVPYFIANKDF